MFEVDSVSALLFLIGSLLTQWLLNNPWIQIKRYNILAAGGIDVTQRSHSVYICGASKSDLILRCAPTTGLLKSLFGVFRAEDCVPME